MRETLFVRICRRLAAGALVLGAGLLLAVAFWLASQPSAVATVQAAPPAQNASNEACLACHSKPGMIKPLPSGETLNLTVDVDAFNASVHGTMNFACVQCHTDISGFPHPEFTPRNLRDVTTRFYLTCQQCHTDKFKLTLDSVHERARAAGNDNAAVCADCHNPHTQQRITDPATHQILPEMRVKVPETCARCHNQIFETYKASVHGTALTGEGNPDVPTCIDCHGVHNIADPLTNSFRLKSPQMCAKCHTDKTRMDKYGIPTDVLSTYVSDFHGKTVLMFEKQAPDAETNKPVCFDCHGFHNVSRVDDPKSGLQIKENLLATCRKCHPDAQPNFPDAWMSHYIPSPEHNPLVYYVDLFYQFLIPGVVGGMVVFVAGDAVRRVIDSRKAGKEQG